MAYLAPVACLSRGLRSVVRVVAGGRVAACTGPAIQPPGIPPSDTLIPSLNCFLIVVTAVEIESLPDVVFAIEWLQAAEADGLGVLARPHHQGLLVQDEVSGGNVLRGHQVPAASGGKRWDGVRKPHLSALFVLDAAPSLPTHDGRYLDFVGPPLHVPVRVIGVAIIVAVAGVLVRLLRPLVFPSGFRLQQERATTGMATVDKRIQGSDGKRLEPGCHTR